MGPKYFFQIFGKKPLAYFWLKKSNCSDSSVHFICTNSCNGKQISVINFSKFPIILSQRIFLICIINIKFIISHQPLMLDTFEAHFQIHSVKMHRAVHYGAKIFFIRFLKKTKANPLVYFWLKK